MLLLTALAFTAVLGLALLAIGETVVANGRKILAALAGRSLLAEPTMVIRPVRVRVESRRVSRPLKAQPQLRVAA